MYILQEQKNLIKKYSYGITITKEKSPELFLGIDSFSDTMKVWKEISDVVLEFLRYIEFLE